MHQTGVFERLKAPGASRLTGNPVRGRLQALLVPFLLVALASAAAAATFVIVSHDGQQQWLSRVTDGSGNPDPTYGSVTFVAGPGVPPRRTGSLRLQTNL